MEEKCRSNFKLPVRVHYATKSSASLFYCLTIILFDIGILFMTGGLQLGNLVELGQQQGQCTDSLCSGKVDHVLHVKKVTAVTLTAMFADLPV